MRFARPDGTYWVQCPDCEGTGHVGEYQHYEDVMWIVCEMCQGEGGWVD